MSGNNTIAETLPQIVGIQTFRWYENVPETLERDIDLLAETKHLWYPPAHRAHYERLFAELQQYKTREKVVKNIVVIVGRSVLMQRLANTTTYTGIINYGALGSSATAVNNADTQLGTEVFRKVVASSSFTTINAFIDFFYTKTDTNGTYAEFGTFIDGTGSANTGQMFTHVLTGGWTKSASESMTVSCQYTCN